MKNVHSPEVREPLYQRENSARSNNEDEEIDLIITKIQDPNINPGVGGKMARIMKVSHEFSDEMFI